MTGGLSGNLRRDVDKAILNLSRESKSFVVAGRRFHSCTQCAALARKDLSLQIDLTNYYKIKTYR